MRRYEGWGRVLESAVSGDMESGGNTKSDRSPKKDAVKGDEL